MKIAMQLARSSAQQSDAILALQRAAVEVFGIEVPVNSSISECVDWEQFTETIECDEFEEKGENEEMEEGKEEEEDEKEKEDEEDEQDEEDEEYIQQLYEMEEVVNAPSLLIPQSLLSDPLLDTIKHLGEIILKRTKAMPSRDTLLFYPITTRSVERMFSSWKRMMNKNAETKAGTMQAISLLSCFTTTDLAAILSQSPWTRTLSILVLEQCNIRLTSLQLKKMTAADLEALVRTTADSFQQSSSSSFTSPLHSFDSSSHSQLSLHLPSDGGCDGGDGHDGSDNSSESENDEIHEVVRVIDHQVREGITYYETEWKGYDTTTWEPQKCFLVGLVTTEYWKKLFLNEKMNTTGGTREGEGEGERKRITETRRQKDKISREETNRKSGRGKGKKENEETEKRQRDQEEKVIERRIVQNRERGRESQRGRGRKRGSDKEEEKKEERVEEERESQTDQEMSIIEIGSDEEDGKIYVVDAIVSHEFENDKTLYLTKWQGYTEPTWQEEDCFSDDAILAEYWMKAVEKRKQLESKVDMRKFVFS